MIINYKDGGKLQCTVIEIAGNDIIADEMYVIPVEDIADITDDE